MAMGEPRVFPSQGDEGRAAIDDDADASTVGFTEGRDAEKLAELAGHGRDFNRGFYGGKCGAHS